MFSQFTNSKPKQKKKHAASDSPEIIKSSVNSTDYLKTNADAVKKATLEQGQAAVKSAWEQLLGIEVGKKGSSPIPMQEGMEYSPEQIAQIQEMQEAQQESQKHVETTAEHSKYVQEIVGTTADRKESQESQQKIENLIVELRRLAASVQAVEKAVILQAIGPANAAQMKGKYYENFFEWMLSVIQDARRKVEDSGAWLTTMTSKSKKGVAIGKMKKSMNQLLSGERTAQNQTG